MHKGLTQKEVEDLQSKYGLNIIKTHQNKLIIVKLFEQFASFFILLLLCAAAISFFVGEWVDSILILIIVVVNAFFGLYQELKADAAVLALKKFSVAKVRVFRNGKQVEIDSIYLVPGDVVFLEEGSKIPADAKLISATHLEVNESLLTGESVPLPKKNGDEVFMGTILAKGHGYAQISKIGMATRFGEIAHHLAEVKETDSPLQKKFKSMTKVIGALGVIASILVYFLSSQQGHSFTSSFLLASSLAVAVVPESLPAVMTVILSIGMKHMAERNAIVRKVSAIEALGGVTLIATDKTGTLTENKMHVREAWIGGACQSLDALVQNINEIPSVKTLLEAGILSSTASLVPVAEKSNTYDVLGDPTEGALLLMAHACGLAPDIVNNEWKILEETPFDSETKVTSALATKDDKTFFFMKGAPEKILLRCDQMVQLDGKIVPLQEEYRVALQRQLDQWGAEGLRSLGLCYKKHHSSHDDEKNMIFLGIVGIYDKPRVEARFSIAQAEKAGMRVVMITGDSPQTAESIGKIVGLLKGGEKIVTGDQIEKYSDTELLSILPDVKIFARITPVQKYKIVKLYQSKGEVVAVTGDGVNDAIALKQADVGIAMGKSGTDVARESADIVLLDDNFKTIVSAIEEGRHIVQRLKRSILYLFTGNLSEVLTLLVGLSLQLPPVFLPIQLLYINLISDGLPSLAFAFMPKSEHIMSKNERTSSSFLGIKDYIFIFSTGAAGASLVLAIFLFSNPLIVDSLRTGAFTVMGFMQVVLFYELWTLHLSFKQKRSLLKFAHPAFLWACMLPLILQVGILYSSKAADILHISSAVGLSQLTRYIIVALMILLPLHILKPMIRKA